MVRWVLRRTIGAFGRQWSYDASYLREIYVVRNPEKLSHLVPPA